MSGFFVALELIKKNPSHILIVRRILYFNEYVFLRDKNFLQEANFQHV